MKETNLKEDVNMNTVSKFAWFIIAKIEFFLCCWYSDDFKFQTFKSPQIKMLTIHTPNTDVNFLFGWDVLMEMKVIYTY